MNEILMFLLLCAAGGLFLQMYRPVRQNLKTTTMFTVLFILSILIFGYLMYVLVRPEQF